MKVLRRVGGLLSTFLITTIISVLPTISKAQSVNDLRHMSLEQLADVNVSSVLKTDGKLSEDSAFIYGISQADIVRSGAQTIPEALRLAPNLQVAQTAANQYTFTARGMSANESAQSFPNKLLMLIDGQSVYSPLFSGIYWDAQDVLLADVDRIEVISGPGATLSLLSKPFTIEHLAHKVREVLDAMGLRRDTGTPPRTFVSRSKKASELIMLKPDNFRGLFDGS